MFHKYPVYDTLILDTRVSFRIGNRQSLQFFLIYSWKKLRLLLLVCLYSDFYDSSVGQYSLNFIVNSKTQLIFLMLFLVMPEVIKKENVLVFFLLLFLFLFRHWRLLLLAKFLHLAVTFVLRCFSEEVTNFFFIVWIFFGHLEELAHLSNYMKIKI